MTTLVVSEKPSIAKSLAAILSKNEYRQIESFSTPVYELRYPFKASTTMVSTSVAGHLFEIQFEKALDSWNVAEERLLEPNSVNYALTKGAGQILKQIYALSKQAKYLVLALDNDREGENICFEIIKSIGFKGEIYRLLFSALTYYEIASKMEKLTKPDKNLSDAVEVRYELDLKIGVAFTRYQTKFLQGKYSDLNTNCVSYGPCQTPALNFCVERHMEILKFRPEKYYAVEVSVADNNGNYQTVEYESGRLSLERAQTIVSELTGADLRVLSISESKGKSVRPLPLNTVQMLKLASQYLRMSPQEAMHRAEDLYLRGYLTYPRTESSAYPQGFGFSDIIAGVSAAWALPAIQELKSTGFNPRHGTDAGDHPPITPTNRSGEDLTGIDLSFYNMIMKHFLASLLPDAMFVVQTVSLSAGEHKMRVRSKEVTYAGWQMVYSSNALKEYVDDPEDYYNAQIVFTKDGSYRVFSALSKERYTRPPSYLTESQLLTLMEKNQIGTDASMAQHIHNIYSRNYVYLNTYNRQLVPTQLGVQLISGLRLIDYELVAPTLRSNMENSLTLVAEGKKTKAQMLAEYLVKYTEKFAFFKANITILDYLFESKFESLKQAGKPFLQCQQCGRFTKFIALTPQRIYCSTCDRIYQVPHAPKMIETNATCAYCGMGVAAACGGKCSGKRVLFCPKCYTDGDAAMSRDIEAYSHIAPEKNVACISCLNYNCQVSLRSCYVADCPFCGSGGFDNGIAGIYSNPATSGAKEEFIIEIAPESEFVIEIAPEKSAEASAPRRGPVENFIKAKLYFDCTSYAYNQQICCSSCGSVANLDGKAKLLLDYFCEQCGARMFAYKDYTVCCLCNEELFAWEDADAMQQGGRRGARFTGNRRKDFQGAGGRRQSNRRERK